MSSQVQDVDILLATVTGQIRDLAEVLVPGGRVVALNGADADTVQWAAQNGLRADFMLVEPDRADLEALASLSDEARITVHIDRIFPLDQVIDAHRLGEEGRTTGKIILIP